MCSKYGIYLVTTVKQISDMRMRTRQNFRTVITFELSDSTEYCDFLGIRPENTDISVQGRGLIRKDVSLNSRLLFAVMEQETRRFGNYQKRLPK